MTDERTPHQRFLDRFKQLSPSDGPEDVLEKSGLDMLESTASVTNSEQRVRLFDPTTGDALESISFEAGAVAPSDFPEDWPFVPDQDCTFTRTTAQDRSFSVLYWIVEDDEAALLRLIDGAMKELGWHEHEPTTSLAADTVLLMWYHRDAEWRVLGRRTMQEIVALVLSENRLDLFPPTQPLEHPSEGAA